MKRRSTLTSVSARQALGVAGILGLIALTLCSSQNVLVQHQLPEMGHTDLLVTQTLHGKQY